MLKLEKIVRSREVNILIKDPEGRFTAPLMKAFAIALGIHLALFSLFQITTLTYRGPSTPLPPTNVVAESSSPHVATLASTDLETQLDKRIPIREALEPKLHDDLALSFQHFSLAHQRENRTNNPFESLEEEILFPPSLSDLKTPLPPIQLIVSGTIQNRLIAQTLTQSIPKLPQRAAEVERARCVFSVAVSPTDGRIFWYEAIEHTSIKPLDLLAESLLKSLQFTQEPNQLVTKGTVEIHFNLRSAS